MGHQADIPDSIFKLKVLERAITVYLVGWLKRTQITHTK